MPKYRFAMPLLIVGCGALGLMTACGVSGRANLLAGRWREIAWLRCSNGERVEPETRIGEVDFMKNGELRVTWHPFEVNFYDYRARYEIDADAGTLTLTDIEVINFLPTDVDGTGQFRIDESGNLILTDMWFGTWQTAPTEPVGCGHIFESLD